MGASERPLEELAAALGGILARPIRAAVPA